MVARTIRGSHFGSERCAEVLAKLDEAAAVEAERVRRAGLAGMEADLEIS